MPRPADVATWKHFHEPEKGHGKKTFSRRCKHCNHAVSSSSVARANVHLNGCVAYNTFLQVGNAPTEHSPLDSSRMPTPAQTTTPAVQNSRPGASRPNQTRRDAEKQNLHRLAAKWIYEAGLPLSLLEHPAAREFLAGLNAAYQPPDRKDIVMKLVTDVHTGDEPTAGMPAWLQLWMDRQVPPVRP